MSTSDAESAQRLETALSWDDLALAADTLEQVHQIARHLAGTDRTGYSALFYGPPGTGKTLTATLLGQQFERAVYRIDLSQVVSKYIGETEQNLERLFDAAEHKDWILFFDEADDLFGKRTDVRDSHDRYSDDQVAALLDRIDAYDGLVIVATSRRSKIDDDVLRHFQSMIRFTKPAED